MASNKAAYSDNSSLVSFGANESAFDRDEEPSRGAAARFDVEAPKAKGGGATFARIYKSAQSSFVVEQKTDPKTGKKMGRLKSSVVNDEGKYIWKRVAVVSALCLAVLSVVVAVSVGSWQESSRSSLGSDSSVPASFSPSPGAGPIHNPSNPVQYTSRGASSSYCAVCSNAPPRSWGWLFGWGACVCNAGWGGPCCNVPFLNAGECASYDKVGFRPTLQHGVVAGTPFHANLKTQPCSTRWSMNALGMGVAPVVVNTLYLIIEESPPQYVLDGLKNIDKNLLAKNNWSVVWDFMTMFTKIFTDDRLAEYRMMNELATCKNGQVAKDFVNDPTGLVALHTMGKCYEEEKNVLSELHGDRYKPDLVEMNNFWRLIEPSKTMMGAMVDDPKSDQVPVAWIRKDDIFGWLRVVGSNPDMLRAAKASDFGVDFDVTDDMYNQAMGESGAGTLAAALADNRLFMLDFSLLGEGVLNNSGKWLFAPKALFASVKGKPPHHLVTVAIQQFQKPSSDYPLVGAPKPSRREWSDSTLTDAERKALVRWAIAKTSVQVAESTYFEVVTHFGATHLAMEPFMMATNIALHPTHPIRKLLEPHFEGTLHINQGAVDALIAAGGVIEKIFPPPIAVAQAIAVQASKNFLQNFNDQMLPDTFVRRGTNTVPQEYPFRDDGLLLWKAISDFTTKYVTLTYKDDAAMRADPWLKCFWDMLNSPTQGTMKKTGDNNMGLLYTRSYLSKFLTLIIWTCSGQHAATNFPQRDVGSHISMNPTASWGDGKIGDPNISISKWQEMMPPMNEALDQLNTEYLLGAVHYNRLGYYSEDYKAGWFSGVYRDAELKFQADLAIVKATIDARNKVAGTMRGDGNPYTILSPENTPNSINI